MKKKTFVGSDCCHMELRHKEQSNTLDTLLRLRGGRRRRFRLAAVLETAGGLERFVEGRRGGQLLCGLRLAAALVVAPPAALLRWCRRRRRLVRQSRGSCSGICCHGRRRWVLPRRRVGSRGWGGRRRRRRSRVSRDGGDVQGGHAVVDLDNEDIRRRFGLGRLRWGRLWWGRRRRFLRQAGTCHHLLHHSSAILGRPRGVAHCGGV